MVESIKELREICQSIDREKGSVPLSVRFARKVSIYFTKLLLYTSITGNQTTLLFMLIGLPAGFFFTFGNALLGLIGAILLQLWYIFDHVDGEVARYRKTASITGAYLDYLSHYIIHPYIFACITFGVYSTLQDVGVFYLGFLASISILLIDVADDCLYRAVFLTRISSKNKSPEPQSKVQKLSNFNQFTEFSSSRFYRVAKLIYTSVRVPNILYLILVAVLLDLVMSPFWINSVKLNWMYLMICTYGVLASLSWAVLVIFYVKHKSADNIYFSLFGNNQ